MNKIKRESNEQDESENEYLESLRNGFFYSTEQFDKAVLFVSSGALALSMAFIEKVVVLKDASCKMLLFASWILEAITILLFTINHYISMKVFNKSMKMHIQTSEKRYDWLVKKINEITIVTLALGLFLLIIFIYNNI